MQSTDTEIWKDIIGYEGYYQISNFGSTRSLDRKLWNGHVYFNKPGQLIKSSENDGYLYVDLYKNNKFKTISVHRLVAQAFLPCENFENLVINHIDGDRTNNHVTNLEWVTQKENVEHAKICLGWIPGKHRRRAIKCKETGAVYESIAEAARQLEVKYEYMSAIIGHRIKNSKKLKGLHFEYID